MEDAFKQIIKECGPKHAAIKKSSQKSLDLLQDEAALSACEVPQLRCIVLEPLQMCLESKNGKLASHAVSAIQCLLMDERFHSTIESECEEQWLPLQILNTVSALPTLPEEIQVEVMKLLLNMAFSTAWCMNAKVITKITQFLLDFLETTAKQSLRNTIINAIFRLLEVVFYRHRTIVAPVVGHVGSELVLEAYGHNSWGSIKTAARVTLTQLLTALVGKLRDFKDSEHLFIMNDVAVHCYSCHLSKMTSLQDMFISTKAECESLARDVIIILQYLCEKLEKTQHSGHNHQVEPLLLEGIYAILSNLPVKVREHQEFVDLIWQQLCPTLIAILGNPVMDKSVTSQKYGCVADDIGRGSGCSTTAPNVQSMSAKTIYSIAIELVRLVGCYHSLRPVLESVFHRMLLYPPPIHRHEALKACKELFSNPGRLMDLCGPTLPEPSSKTTRSVSRRKTVLSELSLLKLVIDSIQECCHCNDSSICITTVNLVSDLLNCVEQLVKGHGLSMDMVKVILQESDFGVAYQSHRHQSVNSLTEVTPAINMERTIPDADHDPESDSDDAEGADEPSDQESMSDSEKDLPVHCTTLHDPTEIREKYLKRQQTRNMEYEAVERKCAQEYVSRLLVFLPPVLKCISVTEVDELLQKFSSDICAALAEEPGSPTGGAILNADGVYLATYSALLLNLKLLRNGYYLSEEKSLCMAEQQFIDNILSTDLLVYLSRSWLAEVFQQVIKKDLLTAAGYSDDSLAYKDCALIELLTDMDGLCSREVGGQLMCAYKELDSVQYHNDVLGQPVEQTDKMAIEAGMRFAKCVLMTSWEGVLDVLSILISGNASCGITSSLAILFNAKEETRKMQEAICTSLEALQTAARLSCILGLQDRCGNVFAQLANASCVTEQEDTGQWPLEKKPAIPAVLQTKPKLPRLHAAHALSMDVILSIGLEMGSHSADCWQHVFRCCAHISELEHTYFRLGQNQAALPKVQQDQCHFDVMPSDDINFNNSDEYNAVIMPAEPIVPSINVKEIIKQSSIEAGWDTPLAGGGVLTTAQTSKALCGLSQEVDRLYEDAANKLNMTALVEFLSELCKVSHRQLSTHRHHQGETERTAPSSLPTTALHLYRLGDLMLRCLRSGRPLLHIMRAWSVVAPHFVEAACHKDHSISKKAVHCIHEVVTSLLGNQPELPHFHFNESLCKPFENLLCLELCNGDIQDQVVCSICELVEACTSEIKSGWRPLFGALRAVKIEYTVSEEVNEARQRHIAAVLDVFEVFLNTDNVLVFANAAVDCILCLLKYVRGPGEFQTIDDSDSDSGSDLPAGDNVDNLVLPALEYLKTCCGILSDMWKMPACPVFSGAHRIKADCVRCVDPVIPNMNLALFQEPFLVQENSSSTVSDASSGAAGVPDDQTGKSPGQTAMKTDEKTIDSKSLNSVDSGIDAERNSSEKEEKPKPQPDHDESGTRCKTDSSVKLPTEGGQNVGQVMLTYKAKTLEEIDNHTGVLHVYFLVLEGLASTVSACPKHYQPQTLEMLFQLLRSAAKVPGPTFAINCVNHLLLPMLQSWLRRGNQLTGYWDPATLANFKHCSGLCTDLVVEFIVEFASFPDQESSVEYLLKQCLDVLSECIAQPTEALSRLGCACIRHSLLSCGPMLTERMWQIAAKSLQHAFDVTLYALKQLMTPFHPSSDNFYGDIGQVKVAVRKDCSSLESERLRLLAQQVFLLDSQRVSGSVIDYEAEEDRSYIFLIYPPDQSNITEDSVTRIPFRNVVVGLLSHQILVQTVGCLLLKDSINMIPSERSMIPSSPVDTPSNVSDEKAEVSDMLIQDSQMPGMMRYLSCRNQLALLQCLLESYKAASEFDQRPGLKFLIQKVARADVAANMYKQAGISLTFYIHALMEIVAHQDNICVENTKGMLKKLRAKQAPGDSDSSELVQLYQEAQHFVGPVHGYMQVFVNKMKEIFDEICMNYVDMYLDKEGPNTADRLSDQVLVFLLAQPEELPSLKREKSLKEMVAEKLRKQKSAADEHSSVGKSGDGSEMEHPLKMGLIPLQPTAIQGTEQTLDMAPSHQTPPETSPEHNPAASSDDRVYTVATDRTIKSLMSEYKKHKQVHTMPTFVKATRSKPPPKKEKGSSKDPVEQEIEKQQKNSIMKDSEAHLSSWIEMICSVLQLFHQLPDYQYRAMLPIIFNCITQLICHSKNTRLREVLAQWTYRIGHLYGFALSGDLPPKQ